MAGFLENELKKMYRYVFFFFLFCFFFTVDLNVMTWFWAVMILFFPVDDTDFSGW